MTDLAGRLRSMAAYYDQSIPPDVIGGGGSAPTITTIEPNTDSTAGGGSITINGTGFASGMTVSIGGNPATGIMVFGPTQVICTAPAGTAGTVAVSVTVDGKTAAKANAFTYGPPPTFTSINPTSGPAATATPGVVITGTGFTGATAVWFATIQSTAFTVDSDTQITCTAPVRPAGALAGANVIVQGPFGQVQGNAVWSWT